ncbi:MAG: alcohol dehydrogenase catalytic domain-containing protein [Rhodospirillaceae bacterium]|nr:alcohol dehydrogenase catalytic domain-containing protein [Rhodospirillaceae bacterium]
MKAMVLEAPGEVAMRDLPMPEPAPGDALVRITHSGICGTDSKIFTGAIPAKLPVVMGHEIVGEIVEGKAADGSGPGTRVLIDPVMFCGTCFHCRAGQTHLCPTGTLMGREINGGFEEYCTAPAAHLFPLSDDIDDVVAPLIQVLTTVRHAFTLSKLVPGEAVAVLGLGVTGLMQVQLAKALGADPVIGVSRNEYKRGLAMDMGADQVASHGAEAKQAILASTDGRGADLVVESVGHLSVLAEAMDVARTGGRVLPFGIYSGTEATLPFYELYFKELNVISARAARAEDFPACIELLRNGSIDLAPLITHTEPFTELSRAISMLSESGERRLKIILEH